MSRKVSVVNRGWPKDAYPASVRGLIDTLLQLPHFFRYWCRCSKGRKDEGEQSKQHPGESVHREVEVRKATKGPKRSLREDEDWIGARVRGGTRPFDGETEAETRVAFIRGEGPYMM